MYEAIIAIIALVVVGAVAVAAPAPQPTVEIRADRARVGMGRTLTVTATAKLPDGRPAAGRLLLPYVNGKRWGSHEYADARGRAIFMLPMPNPGIADVQVTIEPELSRPVEEWIWDAKPADGQRLFLQGSFAAPAGITEATLWVAADDAADVYINGAKVLSTGGWTTVKPARDIAQHLRPGRNVLSVEARNGTGPAGLLARLEWHTPTADGLFTTDKTWRAYATAPEGWPASQSASGEPVVSLGRVDQALWSGMMTNWPTVGNRDRLIAGTLMPADAVASKPVRVEAYRRPLRTIKTDPDHLVGMQWEPWFTPTNITWSTAQAVPVQGFFWSWNPDVMRQHMLWFAESGIDFLVVDWTNHLWDKKHWDERPDATNEIIHCTTLALEILASMRDEGIAVPKLTILTGLNNGPATTMEALNEEHAWIYHNYVRNPRFKGLFVEYLGKPLMLPFNGGGPKWLENLGGTPVDDSHFTIRWNSSQHQFGHHNENGYWSWMDGDLRQPYTLYEGKPEAMTVSCAFFGDGGWLYPQAYGRRNGWTYVESFRQALEIRPRFVQLHQFNEYAGQPEGQGYGAKHDNYYDSYSAELSDDLEPTSLTAPAYRGDGGWGFVMLNLTRALVDLYHQDTPVTTVVAIGKPLRGAVIRGDTAEVDWTWVGKKPESFAVYVNGRQVARGLQGHSATIHLECARDGAVTVRVVAEGTTMRYAPSWTEDSLPLAKPAPAYADVTFTLKRK
jgi:hypothetical protein